MTLQQPLDLGDRITILETRINPRAKRLILKVDSTRNVAIVTVPHRRAADMGLAFAKERRSWISAQLASSIAPAPFHDGMVIPFRGNDHQIILADCRRRTVCIRTDSALSDIPIIEVGGDAAHLNRRITDWLKTQARQHITARADHFADQLQVQRGPVTIRDPRSRWGSCSSTGALSFSWRLILSPDWILDYVTAHECAHLIHMDHSPAFWDTVARLGSDAKAARHWFRDNSQRLWSYGIETASDNASTI